MSHRKVVFLLAWLLLLAACLPSMADEKEQQGVHKGQQQATKFIRLRRVDEEPVAMDTAIVSYVPADGTRRELIVELIGAVHVADKAYYDKLNDLFQSYDAMLYELVAPPGTRIPKGGQRGGSTSPVSGLQNGLKTMLELEFQLDWIDYTRPNLVHADMSPEEMAKSMNDRGESFMQIFFQMMGQSIAMQNSGSGATSDLELLLALFSKDRAFRLKRIMAEQMQDLSGPLAAFGGPDGSTIITERNKKALEVLVKQIKNGKKRIGIFYGAGHLPDMEERLINQFGLKRADQRWVQAWRLTKQKKTKSRPAGDARRGKKPDASRQPQGR